MEHDAVNDQPQDMPAEEQEPDADSGGPRPPGASTPWYARPLGLTALVLAGALLGAAVTWAATRPETDSTAGTSAGGAPSATVSAPAGSGAAPDGDPAGAEGAGPSSIGGSAPGSAKPGAPTGAQPGSPPSSGRDIRLAARGSEIPTLTAPPTKTLGMLQLPDGFKAATWTVRFSPYGWGPGGEASGHVVVKIEKAEAGQGADDFRDLTGVNASLYASPQESAKVKVGGVYEGRLTLRAQGDAGVLMLSDVSPAN